MNQVIAMLTAKGDIVDVKFAGRHRFVARAGIAGADNVAGAEDVAGVCEGGGLVLAGGDMNSIGAQCAGKRCIAIDQGRYAVALNELDKRADKGGVEGGSSGGDKADARNRCGGERGGEPVSAGEARDDRIREKELGSACHECGVLTVAEAPRHSRADQGKMEAESQRSYASEDWRAALGRGSVVRVASWKAGGMAVSSTYKDFIAGLLEPVGPVSIKRMFGGAGVYAEGVTFAIIDDDVMYLKVDDATRPKFESAGMGPFTYTSKSGQHALSSYWRCPERLYDEPEELQDWARESIAVARRAAAAKPKPKPANKPKKTRGK